MREEGGVGRWPGGASAPHVAVALRARLLFPALRPRHHDAILARVRKVGQRVGARPADKLEVVVFSVDHGRPGVRWWVAAERRSACARRVDEQRRLLLRHNLILVRRLGGSRRRLQCRRPLFERALRAGLGVHVHVAERCTASRSGRSVRRSCLRLRYRLVPLVRSSPCDRRGGGRGGGGAVEVDGLLD